MGDLAAFGLFVMMMKFSQAAHFSSVRQCGVAVTNLRSQPVQSPSGMVLRALEYTTAHKRFEGRTRPNAPQHEVPLSS
jgi:hypothetical protein